MTGARDLASLREAGSHFAFGQNWASYADLIDEERVAEAERGLVRLLGPDGVKGRTFLDIGCGSGLHAAAAIRLGAARVVALDIDPVSVETTRAGLRRFAPGASIDVRELSVFDLDPATNGTFDIVYSWGVLHHTGAMREAVRKAARMVAPDGVFARSRFTARHACVVSGRAKSAGTSRRRRGRKNWRVRSTSSCFARALP